MSTWSGGEKRPTKGGGWNKKKSASSREGEPDWRGRSSGKSRSKSAGRRVETLWGFYALAAAGLVGLFLFILLRSSEETPVIIATGLNYPAPGPVNAWAWEDAGGLMSDDLSDRLSTRDLSSAEWSGPNADAKEAFVAALAEHKRIYRGFRRIDEPLIVYLSMPGVVAKQGTPYLAPPGASLIENDEWIEIDWIVSKLTDPTLVHPDRVKLLVLDSNQLVINWELGIVCNTFVERLKAYVDSSTAANVAILTAADQGQMSWASPQLGGTAFGSFFRLGLAGAADRGPNADGDVSLRELTEYVQAEVDRWASSTRDSRQTPLLLTNLPDLDVLVSHSVDGSRLATLEAEVAKEKSVQPSAPTDRVGRLWEQLKTVRQANAIRLDPLRLAWLERRLIRLEQLAYGGGGYVDEAQALLYALEQELSKAVDAASQRDGSFASHWGVTNPTARSLQYADLPTLGLRQYFQPGYRETDDIRALWQWIATSAGSDRGASRFDKDLLESATALETTQWLTATRQQNIAAFARGQVRRNALLSLRDQAGALSVPPTTSTLPGDEQAHYYARAFMDQGDQARRLAEDSLFVGDPLNSESEAIEQAESGYKTARIVADRVATALAACHEAWAVAPHLAQWLNRRTAFQDAAANEDTPEKPDSVLDLENLMRLVAQADDLGREIDAMNVLRSAGGSVDLDQLKDVTDRFEVRADSIQSLLRQLRTKFDNAAELGDAISGRERRNFDRVLATPLVEASSRADSLTRRDALEARLHRLHFAESANTPAEPPNATAMGQRLSRWDRSPLLTLLEPSPAARTAGEASGKNVTSRFEDDSARARALLLQVSRLDVRGAESQEPDHLEDRVALSAAARRIRAAAALTPASPRIDPIERLRLFDVQQLLLWNAHRTLHGFWETQTSPRPKSAPALIARRSLTGDLPAPYFAEAANRLIAAADRCRVGNEASPLGVARQFDKTRQRVKRLVAASRGFASVDGQARRDLATTGQHYVTAEVTSTSDETSRLDGRIAVFVEEDGSSRLEAYGSGGPWGFVDLPISADETTSISARVRGIQSARVQCVGFYRGRELTKAVEVPGVDDAPLRYAWPQYDRQTVTLEGVQPAPPSLVFILDCSSTMRFKIDAERGEPQTRMNVAKSALREMFETMAERRGAARFSVGVILFGHRVGYGPVGAGGRRPQKSNAAYESLPGVRIPDNLAPGLDVEVVLPLGKFLEQELGMINRRLRAVDHLGLTPVYLAITQALDQFEGDRNPTQSIIVITDGQNDQKDYNDVEETTAKAVMDKWDAVGKPIPIYIVGFGIDEQSNDPKLRRGIAEFKDIAARTGGDYLPTDSGADLIRELEKRLTINGYLVREVGGRRLTADKNTGEERKLELGTPVDVPAQQFPLPVDLEVEFQRTIEQVTVEGGEALRIRVADDGRFIPVPYDRDVAQEKRLVSADGGSTSRALRIHTPKRSGSRVKFRMSVQDTVEHFTARPRSLWIEVSADRGNRSYWFYDPVYQPDVQTPLVEFPVDNWPAGANYAQVRFWCSDPNATARTRPLKSIRLSDVLSQQIAGERFSTTVTTDNGEVRVFVAVDEETRRVTVEESHGDRQGPDGVGNLRVGFAARDGLTPEAVSHNFMPAYGFARHTFEFPRDRRSAAAFAEALSIEIESASDIKRRCLRTPDEAGVRVRVVDADDTLTPTTDRPTNY